MGFDSQESILTFATILISPITLGFTMSDKNQSKFDECKLCGRLEEKEYEWKNCDECDGVFCWSCLTTYGDGSISVCEVCDRYSEDYSAAMDKMDQRHGTVEDLIHHGTRWDGRLEHKEEE